MSGIDKMLKAKKEIVAGTVLLLWMAFWVMSVFIEAIDEGRLSLPPLISNPATAKIIGWAATIYLFVALSIWIIAARKATDTRSNVIKNVEKRFSVRILIPGHFISSLIPVVFSMGPVIITGSMNWGWLACMSAPILFVLLLLELNRNA
jgi:hypothetical protein